MHESSHKKLWIKSWQYTFQKFDFTICDSSQGSIWIESWVYFWKSSWLGKRNSIHGSTWIESWKIFYNAFQLRFYDSTHKNRRINSDGWFSNIILFRDTWLDSCNYLIQFTWLESWINSQAELFSSFFIYLI